MWSRGDAGCPLNGTEHRDPGLTPTQLSELAAISGPPMTNRIRRLTSRGLVERRGGEYGRRSVRAGLTRQGRALVERLLPEHLANTAQILSGVSPEEAQPLWRLAARLLVGLEGQETEPEAVQAGD